MRFCPELWPFEQVCIVYPQFSLILHLSSPVRFALLICDPLFQRRTPAVCRRGTIFYLLSFPGARLSNRSRAGLPPLRRRT